MGLMFWAVSLWICSGLGHLGFIFAADEIDVWGEIEDSLSNLLAMSLVVGGGPVLITMHIYDEQGRT